MANKVLLSYFMSLAIFQPLIKIGPSRNFLTQNYVQFLRLYTVWKLECFSATLISREFPTEIFSDQHWNEMFGLLCMPRKGISELKFKDFLDVKHKLNEHSQVRYLKHCSQIKLSK